VVFGNLIDVRGISIYVTFLSAKSLDQSGNYGLFCRFKRNIIDNMKIDCWETVKAGRRKPEAGRRKEEAGSRSGLDRDKKN
jgi:hypothetical protein